MKEIQLSVKHTPCYGQFYLQDPNATGSTADFTRQEIERDRLAARSGLLAIFVQSEIDEIPIDVELTEHGPAIDNSKPWDRIVEAPIHVSSDRVVLAGCPDGPVYGKFGEVMLPSGDYTVRIYYGGQTAVGSLVESEDFYKIQLWPGTSSGVRQLKP